ncbi:MAG: glycosyltransferase family 2 protein [Bacteroidia bacterium]
MRVSVVLPFINADKMLPQAVNSVLEQSESCELILVDNNTHPSDLALLLAQKYAQINLVQEPQTGIVNALNAGIAASSCPYIARMDADDVMLPHRLKLQADFLDEHPDIKLVSGLVEYGGDSQMQKGYFEYVEQINSIRTPEHMYWYRFIESPVAHPSVMFRKNMTSRVPPYLEGSFPEDYELWLHVLNEHPYSFAKLDVPILRWNDAPQRLSRQHPAYSDDAFSRIRLAYLANWLLQKCRITKPILIIGGGKKAKLKIRQLQELGLTIDAFSDLMPRKIDGITFIPWYEVVPKRGFYLISLVSNRHAWKLIESELLNRGFVRETDFILAN